MARNVTTRWEHSAGKDTVVCQGIVYLIDIVKRNSAITTQAIMPLLPRDATICILPMYTAFYV